MKILIQKEGAATGGAATGGAASGAPTKPLTDVEREIARAQKRLRAYVGQVVEARMFVNEGKKEIKNLETHIRLLKQGRIVFKRGAGGKRRPTPTHPCDVGPLEADGQPRRSRSDNLWPDRGVLLEHGGDRLRCPG